MKRKEFFWGEGVLFLGVISLVMMEILYPKIVINFPEPIRKFAEKKNHIGFISLLFYKIGECGVMTMGFYMLL